MLVVVSILMALSAPLIAKRTSTDAQKLVRPDSTGRKVVYYDNKVNPPQDKETDNNNKFASIFTAIGLNNHQNFGIGTNRPNAKLHVQSTANNVDLLNVSRTNITKRDIGANNFETGLFVNNAGETNIVACVPDYEKKQEIDWGATQQFPAPGNVPNAEDGYIALRSNCVKVYRNLSLEHIVCPPIYVTGIDVNAGTVTNSFVGTPAIFPVNKNQIVAYAANNDADLSVTLNSIQKHPDNADYFIPCKKGYKAYTRGQ